MTHLWSRGWQRVERGLEPRSAGYYFVFPIGVSLSFTPSILHLSTLDTWWDSFYCAEPKPCLPSVTPFGDSVLLRVKSMVFVELTWLYLVGIPSTSLVSPLGALPATPLGCILQPKGLILTSPHFLWCLMSFCLVSWLALRLPIHLFIFKTLLEVLVCK